LNIGLPAVECEQADRISEGNLLEVELAKGVVRNISKGESYAVKPFPPQLRVILSEGGLVSYVKKHGKLPW
jgi:3-isopropylmalate/(R)-2-methylmalate dehydratase small subunit